jgi:hypothetical protein
MTSEEIKVIQYASLSTNGWLKEIAMQLALLNEKKGPGRPPK